MNLGFNVVICPPCGEKVGLPTKRGAHKVSLIWPLLPRLKAVLPPQGREMFRGFTLIELLVVVLIIGILAAVAVPQYQMAVMKSRYATLKSIARSIVEAEEVFYLATSSYTDDLSELDVTIPVETICEVTGIPYTTNVTCYILDAKGDPYLDYSQRFLHTDAPHRRVCQSHTYDLTDLSNKICQHETKRKAPDGYYGSYVAWGY